VRARTLSGRVRWTSCPCWRVSRPQCLPPSVIWSPTAGCSRPQSVAATGHAGDRARCRYRPWAGLIRLTLGLPVDTLGPAPCPTRLRRARRPLRGTHAASRPGPRPREHRAPFRHQGLWTEPLGRAEARPPPCFRSITRLEPTPKPSCSSGSPLLAAWPDRRRARLCPIRRP
jgi:hypothetical protein